MHKMVIPTVLLRFLRTVHPDLKTQVVKRETTDDPMSTPDLDFDMLRTGPLSQVHINRNNFGDFVYSAKAPRFLRLHLGVPCYPANEGEAKALWMSTRTEVANSAIESISDLVSINASDLQGKLGELLPAILNQASTLQFLTLHSEPHIWHPSNSILTAEQVMAMAGTLIHLTHLEIDIESNTSGDQMAMPFTSSDLVMSALAQMPSF